MERAAYREMAQLDQKHWWYRARRKDTLSKRLTSRVANFVRSRFTRDGVRDTGCTLKAMRRECREALGGCLNCPLAPLCPGREEF